MFAHLHTEEEGTIIVNVFQVTSIKQKDSGGRIRLTDGRELSIKTSSSMIAEKFKKVARVENKYDPYHGM